MRRTQHSLSRWERARVRAYAPSVRDGTTLTEVLISILIMAIGVVTCATLFPVSVMRSVQATQLTHATILRHNIDSLLEANPDLILNPEGAGYPAYAQTNYVVDPLGKALFSSYTNSTIGDIAPPNGLNRYTTAGATTEQAAYDLASLPDSWDMQFEAIPEQTDTLPATTNEYVQFSASDVSDGRVDLDMIEEMITPLGQPLISDPSRFGQGLTVRIVLFDRLGRLSETRVLPPPTPTFNPIDAAARRIYWTQKVPQNGRYSAITNVRVETQERNYTWLLTVRNQSNTPPPAPPPGAPIPPTWTLSAEVSVAVFFRRSFDPADERVFSLSGAGDTYTFNWSAGQRPALKKGGFLLDIDAAKWWRIETVKESGNTATFVINGEPQEAITRAVFMRGVVDVFPIGIKEKQ